jgi:hypothetical protein
LCWDAVLIVFMFIAIFLSSQDCRSIWSFYLKLPFDFGVVSSIAVAGIKIFIFLKVDSARIARFDLYRRH